LPNRPTHPVDRPASTPPLRRNAAQYAASRANDPHRHHRPAQGRSLGHDDVEHYRRTTEALRQTIRLMGEIDAAIPSWPIE
jgi:hypothetical protein